MSLFRAHILPGGLGRYHTLVATHLLSSVSAQYSSICPMPWPNFLISPFFSPHLLPFIFLQAWGQPVQLSYRCAWVVLAHEGSITHFCAFGFALLARGSARRRAAGRSGWEHLCLPPPPAWAPRSNSFLSNIFPYCCQTHPDRGNESALFCRLPTLRNKMLSPTPKCFFCVGGRLSIPSNPDGVRSKQNPGFKPELTQGLF